MKKFFGLLTALLISLMLVACSGDSADKPIENPEEQVVDEQGEDPSYRESEVDETDEDITDPLAADHEILVNWISEIIPTFEEIDTERPLFFNTTIAGFVTGTRSVMEDSSASSYLRLQVENVLEFLEGVQSIIAQNIDSDDLDLVELRDTIITALNDTIETFSGE